MDKTHQHIVSVLRVTIGLIAEVTRTLPGSPATRILPDSLPTSGSGTFGPSILSRPSLIRVDRSQCVPHLAKRILPGRLGTLPWP